MTFFAVEGLLPVLRTIVVPENQQKFRRARQQASLAESAVGPDCSPTVNVAEAIQEGIQAAVMIALMDYRFSSMQNQFRQQAVNHPPKAAGQPIDRVTPSQMPCIGTEIALC